jgi:hypothetical protein
MCDCREFSRPPVLTMPVIHQGGRVSQGLLALMALMVVIITGVFFCIFHDDRSELDASGVSVVHPPKPALSPALFQLGDRTYGFEALSLEFREPLYEIRKLAYQQQLLVLEQAIVESHIERVAAEQMLSRESVLQQLFPDALPSEEELRRFYEENQGRDTPPFSRVRQDIADHLIQQNREGLKKQLLTDLLVRGEARLLVEAPMEPRQEGAGVAIE